jgi:hypothetical protein
MLTGSNARASEEPPPPVTAGHSVWTDYGDGLYSCRVERQQVPVVLEQCQALASGVQSNRAISHRVSRVGRIELRAVEEAVAQNGPQNPQHLVVDGGLLHRPSLTAARRVFSS